MIYAIETENLTKWFRPGSGLFDCFIRPPESRKKILVLNKVNLNVRQGEIFALLGSNGAGKTTLMKILATLIIPNEGSARVNGYCVLKEDAKVKESIAMVVGEERSFYWKLTGYQNLEFFGALNNIPKKKLKKRIETLKDLLDLEGLHRRYQELSTGLKNRLSIARALLKDAQILFMDEPTKSLDSHSAQNLRNLIKERLCFHGKTIFFITHNPKEAEELADRIGTLHKGVLIKEYTPGQKQELNEYTKRNL